MYLNTIKVFPMLRVSIDSHSKRPGMNCFIKQRVFLRSEELCFSQIWSNCMTDLAIGTFIIES